MSSGRCTGECLVWRGIWVHQLYEPLSHLRSHHPPDQSRQKSMRHSAHAVSALHAPPHPTASQKRLSGGHSHSRPQDGRGWHKLPAHGPPRRRQPADSHQLGHRLLRRSAQSAYSYHRFNRGLAELARQVKLFVLCCNDRQLFVRRIPKLKTHLIDFLSAPR